MTMVTTAAGITMAAAQRRIMTTLAQSTVQIYSARLSPLLDPRTTPSGEPALASITQAFGCRFSCIARPLVGSISGRPVRQFLTYVRFISCFP